MHGTIFVELRKYVVAKLGSDGWPKLLEEAGIPNRAYLPLLSYQDEEMTALVGAATKITGASTNEFLGDFGESIAGDLIGMYPTLVQGQWKTLDLIENTEQIIHAVVRKNMPGASPPELRTVRRSADELLLVYASQRMMCPLVAGIIRGVAQYYGERITVGHDQSCMLKGGSTCNFIITILRE